MPRVYLYLDKRKDRAIRRKLIFLYLRYGRKTFKYSTQERIIEALWNDNTQRAKASPKAFPLYKQFNQKLSRIIRGAEEAYYELFSRLNREPEPKEIKILLDEKLNRSVQIIPNLFVNYMEKYIQDNKSIRVEAPYNTTLSLLKRFVKDNNNKAYHLEEIDVNFYYKFTAYCINNEYANKTTNKHIKRVKEILRYADNSSLKVSPDYRTRKFKKLKEVASTVVFLTSDEIERIFKYNFSDDKKLEKVRDLFIIGCCTGLRFSDLSRLNQVHVIKKENALLINTTTEKGKIPVTIPLHHYLESILQKYNNNPPSISSQKANKYIKEVCQIVGISGKIEELKMIGTKLKRTPKERYDKVSYHNARHSFARNAYLSGIDIEKIRIIIGHSSIRQTREYIRATELETALELVNDPFFTGKKK